MSTHDLIQGQAFDTDMSGTAFHFNNIKIDITDNSTVGMKNGRPKGRLRGDVAATVKIKADLDDVDRLLEIAREAGSFQAMDPFDVTTYAKVGSREKKIEAFGVSLKIASLLDAQDNSSDESFVEIEGDVTSEDFLKIDGVPYITPLEN